MKRKILCVVALVLILLQMQTPILANVGLIADNANFVVTLNLDYPLSKTKALDMRIALLKDNDVLGEVKLSHEASTQTISANGKQYNVQILPGLDRKSITVTFEKLLLGDYSVKVMGNGYKTYLSKPIELLTSEKHLVIGTSRKNLKHGDFNQDGYVDLLDFTFLEENLFKNNLKYDTNTINQVNLNDIAKTYWNAAKCDRSKLYNTRFIMSQIVDETKIEEAVANANPKTTIIGEIKNLFDNSDESELILQNNVPISEENSISIPIDFGKTMLVSQVVLTAPTQMAPQVGYVVYTNENGEMIKQPFTNVTTYTSAKSRRSSNIITINLGTRVPVNKIILETTETNKDQSLVVAVSKVEILEDIV